MVKRYVNIFYRLRQFGNKIGTINFANMTASDTTTITMYLQMVVDLYNLDYICVI